MANENIERFRNTAKLVKELTGQCDIYLGDTEICFLIGTEGDQDKAAKIIWTRHGQFELFWRGHKRSITISSDANIRSVYERIV